MISLLVSFIMLTYVGDIFVIYIYVKGPSRSDIFYNDTSGGNKVSVKTDVAGC